MEDILVGLANTNRNLSDLHKLKTAIYNLMGEILEEQVRRCCLCCQDCFCSNNNPLFIRYFQDEQTSRSSFSNDAFTSGRQNTSNSVVKDDSDEPAFSDADDLSPFHRSGATVPEIDKKLQDKVDGAKNVYAS